MVFPLPDGLPFDKAAALPLNYLTAHFALTRRAQPKRARPSWCTVPPGASALPPASWLRPTARG